MVWWISTKHYLDYQTLPKNCSKLYNNCKTSSFIFSFAMLFNTNWKNCKKRFFFLIYKKYFYLFEQCCINLFHICIGSFHAKCQMATKTESETNETYNLMRFGRVKCLKICYALNLFVHLLKPFKTIFPITWHLPLLFRHRLPKSFI